MKLSLNTDSVPELMLEDALDLGAELGIESVEIPAGGNSAAPHMRIRELLDNAGARARFAKAIDSRGLRLSAINCSANPLHPLHGHEHLQVMRDSIELASELAVDKIVAMSGCPGDAPDSRTLNWIWFPWPEDVEEIREQQWQTALEVWRDLADFALAKGVERIAIELHPQQLVYNVPTMLRLREAIGPVIGANVDPSHMFWQRMDPVRCVEALGPAVLHVHLKDSQLFDDELALTGVLDARDWNEPSRRSWIFRAVGHGQPASFWNDFLLALRSVGYDDVLSIENEDPLLPGAAGVREAVYFLAELPVARGTGSATGRR